MKNRVVFIYGMPSSGKMTMAYLLGRAAGYQILDNHYFYDFVRPFVTADLKSAEYRRDVHKLRLVLCDMISKFYPRDKEVRLVFTGLLVRNSPSIAPFKKLAAHIGAEFIPIKLVARPDVLMRRCASASRKTRGKVSDADKMRKFIKENELRNIRHKNLLKLDVSDISEKETLCRIQEHISKICGE